MDKINVYQKRIIELFEEYAAVKPANLNKQEYQIIADTQRNHFQMSEALSVIIIPSKISSNARN